jgi:hypothetical protein
MSLKFSQREKICFVIVQVIGDHYEMINHQRTCAFKSNIRRYVVS